MGRDESQIRHYEERIRRMPVDVLTRHGVVRAGGQLVELTTAQLTVQQRSEILMACEQKIQEFIAKRGLALWDCRLLETDPVPDTSHLEL